MEKTPRFCGYSTRHFRRITPNKEVDDSEFLRTLEKKDNRFKAEKVINSPSSNENEIVEESSEEEETVVEELVTSCRIKCSTDPITSSESDSDIEKLPLNAQEVRDNDIVNEPLNTLKDGKTCKRKIHDILETINEESNSEICIDFDDSSDCSLSDLCVTFTESEKLSGDESSDLENEITQNIGEENSTEKDKCFKSALRSWALKFKITLVALTALLLILRLFTDNQLPLDARTLLGTERFTEITEMSDGEYIHFGLKRAVKSMIRENQKNGRNRSHLQLSVNIDGLPIFKSSVKGLWLILVSELDSQKVYPVGAFYGMKKPENANEFLKKFVDEALLLSDFTENNEKFSISLECLTCDTPAKAFVLYLKSHTGYDSCTKCNISGEYVKKKTRKNGKKSGQICFPGTGPFTLKTDEDSRKLETEFKSIMLNISRFGIISSVPLDYMHLVLLGVVKRLIKLWLTGPLKVRLTSNKVDQISRRLLILRNSTPAEINRRPRLLSEYSFWKATEFRTFLLYTGPIALKNIVSPEVYHHFLLLHCALTILVNDTHTRLPSNIDYADELLNEFVKEFANIYGKEYVSQNVHNLLHLCSDVRRFGSVDNFSAFRFENYMSSIKKMIRKGEKPLEQIARRYAEIEKAENENIEVSRTSLASLYILKQAHFNGPLPKEALDNMQQFKVYESKTLTINCNNSKDCCVLLKDGNFAIVQNVAQDNSGKVWFIGEKHVPHENLYDNPNSSLFNIHILNLRHSEKHLWNVEDIYRKVWKVPCQKNIIVIPLAHNLETTY